MDQGASASARGGTQSFAQVWLVPLGQQYGPASSGSAMVVMDAARPLQVQSFITQEQEEDK